MRRTLILLLLAVALASACVPVRPAHPAPASGPAMTTQDGPASSPTSTAAPTVPPPATVPPTQAPADTPAPSFPTVVPTTAATARAAMAATMPGLVETPRSLGFEPVMRNDDWTPYIEEFDGVEMALVPAGCFAMGSTDEQVDDAMRQCEKLRGAGNCERSLYEDEQPVEMVWFAEPFWIDLYEVTNVQYGSSGEWSGDELPREFVNWADAVAHCAGRGARLPTEAEWEYAARGPDGLVFPWGDRFKRGLVNSCDRSCEWTLIGTSVDDGYANTAPVGSYADGASWVGAMDMSGNVWEWTSSIYRPYPYSATDGSADSGADGESRRVLRGGSWYHSGSDLLRSAARYAVSPDYTDYVVGLRCVVSRQ